MSPAPRIARVPHTVKVPDSCLHCGSRVLTRRGIRRKKLEIVQLWRCASCKRTFTPNPAALRNKTYPLRTVLDTLSTYNLGYSLEATVTRTKSRSGRKISPSTISNWLSEYRAHLSYLRLRERGRHLFPPAQTIRSIKLYHRQIYGYAFHRSKVELLRKGELDDRREGDTKFAPLADFLEAVPRTCPHDLFRRDDDPKARASQAKPAFADTARITINSKQNAATALASLIIPAVGNNKLRHETLQNFMLVNDSVTVAIEIPIWLTEPDIAALEEQYGVELAPRTASEDGTRKLERTITGHIDFLQVRNGAVHILDYKPDARTSRPVAQLAIYALALTRLVPGLSLFDIKCAWFNEEEYCEFFPRTLFSKSSSTKHQ